MSDKSSTFDTESFSKEFRKRFPAYEQLCEEASFTLSKKLKESGIKIHSIPFRIKELDKCVEKIERKKYDLPFEQMEDIVGLRVICLFLSDVAKIGDLLHSSFDVIKCESKIEGINSEFFGYMSDHYIAKFPANYSGDKYDDIKTISFEIQVRTIAMDAWANISHYLDYKTDQDIPAELKRDFHALSGMFYVADKHFQFFFEQRREKQEEMAEVFEKGEDEIKFNQPINLDTMTAYLNEKFSLVIPSDSESISLLVNELNSANYKTIGQIEDRLEKQLKAVTLISNSTIVTQIGVITVILGCIDNRFFQVVAKSRNMSGSREKIINDWKEKYTALQQIM